MAINSIKEDEVISSVPKRVTILRLLSYLLKYPVQITAVLLIMVYCVFVSVVNPLFLETALDKYIVNKNFPGLVGLIGVALLMNLVWIILVRIRMHIMAKVSNDAIMGIRDQLYRKLQTLDFKFFDSRPTGKILSRVISDVNTLKDVLSSFVITLIPDALLLIGIIIIMVVKDYRLALATLAGFPLLLVAISYIETRCHKNWQNVRKKSSNVSAFIHESIAGIRVVKAYNAEEEHLETFDELTEEHKQSFIKAVKINDMFMPVVNVCAAISSICMYYIGIKVIGFEEISVGTLFAFGSYIWLFWEPISNLASLYNQLITNVAAAERVFEVLDTEPEIKDKANAICLPPIKGSVEFKNVSFSYEDGVKVLNHVSFAIQPGQTIALVGPTGAGKSTIVNLISRFYDVSDGSVLVDGHNVKDVTIESLRSQMGIMTQDNFLFSTTIRDNIRYGKLDATDEEIEAAAKAVNAHEFIMKLEKGYDTELSERGSSLSSGQRQLIAFARTLLSNPSILILDEATSSIDTKHELMIQEGIRTILEGRTSFIIAHRLSTIRNADLIFVVDDKRIVEAGSHDQLMALKGQYYALTMAQAV